MSGERITETVTYTATDARPVPVTEPQARRVAALTSPIMVITRYRTSPRNHTLDAHDQHSKQ